MKHACDGSRSLSSYYSLYLTDLEYSPLALRAYYGPDLSHEKLGRLALNRITFEFFLLKDKSQSNLRALWSRYHKILL